MRGDEVLENRQALAVVRLNGLLDQLLLRVGHEATHTGDLLNLRPVTTGAGVHHAVHGVALGEVRAHVLGDLFGALQPQLHEFLVAGLLEDDTRLELLDNLGGLGLVAGQDLALARRCLNVGERNRDARPGRPVGSRPT